jgi:hypothetical protein
VKINSSEIEFGWKSYDDKDRNIEKWCSFTQSWKKHIQEWCKHHILKEVTLKVIECNIQINQHKVE